MNILLIIIGTAIATCLGSVLASVDDEWNQLFGDEGKPMRPQETRKVLKRLAGQPCPYKCEVCKHHGKDLESLFGVSEINEDKCQQSYINEVNSLIESYKEHTLNLIPYLKHYKAKLLIRCKEIFDVKDLNSKGGAPLTPEEMQKIKEEEEEAARLEEEKARLERERGEKEESEEAERKRVAKEKWEKEFDEFMKNGDGLASLEETNKKIEDLQSQYFDTCYGKSEEKFQEIRELMTMRLFQYERCNGNVISKVDELTKKYSSASAAVTSFIQHYRDLHWDKCVEQFDDWFHRDIYSKNDDEIKALSLVDHILVKGQIADRPYKEIEPALVAGVIEYVKGGLQKVPEAKEKVIKVYDEVVKLCDDLEYRFSGLPKLGEMIHNRENLKQKLNPNITKLLVVKRTCADILTHDKQIRLKVLRALEKPKKGSKSVFSRILQ